MTDPQQSYNELENVAITMHCNLKPPAVAHVVICLNYDAHTKFLSRSITSFLLIPYVTLRP